MKNPWAFAYFSITTAIGVLVFVMQLTTTNGFLHISLYKCNNAVKCCNTCSGSVLFQYLCYLLTDSMDIRFEISSTDYVFYMIFKLREFILSLYMESNFHLNWTSFQ